MGFPKKFRWIGNSLLTAVESSLHNTRRGQGFIGAGTLVGLDEVVMGVSGVAGTLP